MKNIHVLPTDKPSRLFYDISLDKLILATTAEVSKWFDNKHIYITNSEEIKEGDWIYCRTENRLLISNVSYSKLEDRFKIILTTDPELIEDGVQAIDDEFLEWFVKNPSCEFVEVTRDFADEGIKGITYYGKYFIIIPQEEPKQAYNNLNYGGGFTEEDIKRISDKPKQETLEEFINSQPYYGTCTIEYKEGIEVGAKWQAERMYSEEEAKTIWKAGQEYWKTSGASITFEELTEQFKKKI